MRTTADAIVIGGGVIGGAVAWFLAKAGLQVTLCDAGAVAGGTSCRCDGNVLVQDKMPGYDSMLTKLSLDLFPGLADELGYDIGWTQRGSLTVFESEEELEVARDFCSRLAATGLPVRILDRKEVHDDEPHLAPDITGGLECDCDGALNPMALAHGLAYGLERLGGQTLAYTPVTDIETNAAGRVSGVGTTRGRIAAPLVVNAAGVWSGEIGRMVGVDVPVKPRQGQILVSERNERVARRKVMEFGYMMAKFDTGGYSRQVTEEMCDCGVALVFEPTGAGNFLIGSSRRFVERDRTTTRQVLRAMAQRAIRFFPVIADIGVIRSYAGLRPFTPDHLPIISESAVPGFWVATGHEGDGIGLSLITGKLVSQLITGQEPEADVTPLRLDRFDKPAAHGEHP